MKAVVDTNVIVSALMNVNGTPAKILSLILNGNIKILYDNRIIFEYIDVLSRKEFGFSQEIINNIIDYFKHDGEFINSEYIKTKFSDEADKKFYEVYKTGEAKYLITGNIKHFPKEDAIIIPKDFMQIYESK
ncbi:MAG: putative toxin-antitoxin system toxin component, PIN family [Treponema sp.]|jgi:putative PIN family toxin of toxin-antitoxin system|nr:putative toxin-antitoxin system toxin component, PIN family [Treponema sp.]